MKKQTFKITFMPLPENEHAIEIAPPKNSTVKSAIVDMRKQRKKTVWTIEFEVPR